MGAPRPLPRPAAGWDPLEDIESSGPNPGAVASRVVILLELLGLVLAVWA